MPWGWRWFTSCAPTLLRVLQIKRQWNEAAAARSVLGILLESHQPHELFVCVYILILGSVLRATHRAEMVLHQGGLKDWSMLEMQAPLNPNLLFTMILASYKRNPWRDVFCFGTPIWLMISGQDYCFCCVHCLNPEFQALGCRISGHGIFA